MILGTFVDSSTGRVGYFDTETCYLGVCTYNDLFGGVIAPVNVKYYSEMWHLITLLYDVACKSGDFAYCCRNNSVYHDGYVFMLGDSIFSVYKKDIDLYIEGNFGLGIVRGDCMYQLSGCRLSACKSSTYADFVRSCLVC